MSACTNESAAAWSSTAAVWLLLYGTYVNWATTLLSGLTGAGAKMLPLGGAGHHGPAWAEAIVPVGLLSLSAAMVIGVSLVVWGAARNVAGRG